MWRVSGLALAALRSAALAAAVAAPPEPAGTTSFKQLQLDGLTRALLLSPASDAARRRRIEHSLRRLEGFAEDGGEALVVVNVPGRWLRASVPGREPVWMKVVVGAPETPTSPVGSRIERIVLNPAWVVPPGPALARTLSAVQRDARYLDDCNVQVLKDGVELDPRAVPWPKLSTAAFPFRLRQQPGPLNPLGRLEFVFPNRQGIHLHDTPQRNLFAEEDRAASLGCVRLEQAFELAALLLGGTPGWTLERLRREAGSGIQRTIWLAEPVRLEIVDWKAWVGPDGAVRFGKEPFSPARGAKP